MLFDVLSAEVPLDLFDQQTDENKRILFRGEQEFRIKLQKENKDLKRRFKIIEQGSLFIQEKYLQIKDLFFGKSSEKSKKKTDDKKDPKNPKEKKRKVQLPSERYPNVPIVERHITLESAPDCGDCGTKMIDSGLTEDSEYLTVIPKHYEIVRQRRHKYCCKKCFGGLETAPAIPRIKPGSAYSDEMMIDVALSKYCDLIPIERYSAMAAREGFSDIPANSLIETTHYVADFVEGAYEKIRDEIHEAKILHGDETPHRMLEGDSRSNWYLWGFSTLISSLFEIHRTRSGDVASEILKKSKCEYLMTDVYSGYGKSVKDTNEYRKQNQIAWLLIQIFCNSHSRRKFVDSELNYKESEFYIEQYKKIYALEAMGKEDPSLKAEYRKQMIVFFEQMRDRGYEDLKGVSEKSSLATAIKYFLNNYAGLTLFTNNVDLPIDNNSQERLLRSAVVGRKTWYGTHSKRGAKTAAILFSLVETCKLNKVNPREYFRCLIRDLLLGKEAYSPATFRKNQTESSA